MKLRIATRRSPLARWQAEHVAGLIQADRLLASRPSTSWSRRPAIAAPTFRLWNIGGKGVFVKEVEAAVLSGRADLAVHSAKDLPSIATRRPPPGRGPGAGDPADVLVGAAPRRHPARRPGGHGCRAPAGPARRSAARPDLRRPPRQHPHPSGQGRGLRRHRGRGRRARPRLGLADRIAEGCRRGSSIPQVGQGALAVECRAGAADAAMAELVAEIEHGPSRRAVDAERAFLAELGGDCTCRPGPTPPSSIDAATIDDPLAAVLASLDGHIVLRHHTSGDRPGSRRDRRGPPSARPQRRRRARRLVSPAHVECWPATVAKRPSRDVLRWWWRWTG